MDIPTVSTYKIFWILEIYETRNLKSFSLGFV